MSEIYNKDYYENYNVGIEDVNYADSKYTKDFLQGVAKRIVEDLHPKTVLDAGCALGHLVAALRDLGVEAYGIDVSDYAIEHVRDDIKPYCAVCSLTSDSLPKEFPSAFDMVISIEVIEHLYEEDCEKAIQNIVNWGNSVIISSTGNDLEDKTHVNVRQTEHWVKCFAKYGLYHQLDYNINYISKDAFLLQRCDNVPRVIEDYERHARIAEQLYQKVEQLHQKVEQLHQKEVGTLNQKIHEQIVQNEESQKKIYDYVQQVTASFHLKDDYEKLFSSYCKALDQIHGLETAEQNYLALKNSTYWKLTKPLRMITNGCKKVVKKSAHGIRLLKKGLISVKNYGFRVTWDRARRRNGSVNQFRWYMQKHKPTDKDLQVQTNTKFGKDITFSIVVPLYNTPAVFLKEMIQSVQAQTYDGWQLCLADASDDSHGEVGSICQKYAQGDQRILYTKLADNKGISANTNAAMEMATGDYFALLDHDDLLHPSALYFCMKAIEEKNADFIYSDEMTFEETVDNVVLIHFKPDFCIDNLRSYNYICHLTVFSRELQQKVGYFSLEHNGSQDYDLILRLTEQAQLIVHVPEVLYFWRAHKNSVATDISAKTYAIEDAHRALEEHYERLQIPIEKVEDTRILSIYKTCYKIKGEPMISILIPNKDHIGDLDTCLKSILAKSTYQNFEIIVIENNSVDPQTFDYYKAVKARDPRIQVVHYQGGFNYSLINNFGVEQANGEYYLLLNNDVEVITPDWLQEMLMYAQRDDVGAVGAMLYYPDDTIQHAGVVIGIGGIAGHSHRCFPKNSAGYMGRLVFAQNYSAVTAACLLVSKEKYQQVEGLDEGFQVAFNDVDFCMKLQQKGYYNVFTPFAELYHHESKSRGLEDTHEKQKRFSSEVKRFEDKWGKALKQGDPCYNPNLTLDHEDFSLA